MRAAGEKATICVAIAEEFTHAILGAISWTAGRSVASADMPATHAKPDFEAHQRAIRSPFPAVAKELRELLGARLVAYLGGVQSTRAVREWAEGARTPSQEEQQRLRLALQVALLITDADDNAIAQAWFQGMNPQLDDRSPARMLRDGALSEAGPAVVAAARAFLVGG